VVGGNRNAAFACRNRADAAGRTGAPGHRSRARLHVPVRRYAGTLVRLSVCAPVPPVRLRESCDASSSSS
jgi:hypothetical protein